MYYPLQHRRVNARMSLVPYHAVSALQLLDTSPADPGGSATSVNISPALAGKNRLVVLFRFIVPISVVSDMANQSNGIEVSRCCLAGGASS